MGKTQTAFTLSGLINVIYANFIPTIVEHSIFKSQKIYMLFEGIAGAYAYSKTKSIAALVGVPVLMVFTHYALK